MGRSIEEIKEALKVIGKLNHHPGLQVRPVDVPRISPDILVDYSDDGDGYTVKLARGNTPRLRISPQYRELMRTKRPTRMQWNSSQLNGRSYCDHRCYSPAARDC